MGKIKGWRKVRDTKDNVVYVKIDSLLRLSLSEVKPKYWVVNLYEKKVDGYRLIKNLRRGYGNKREAKKFSYEYMRSHQNG